MRHGARKSKNILFSGCTVWQKESPCWELNSVFHATLETPSNSSSREPCIVYLYSFKCLDPNEPNHLQWFIISSSSSEIRGARLKRECMKDVNFCTFLLFVFVQPTPIILPENLNILTLCSHAYDMHVKTTVAHHNKQINSLHSPSLGVGGLSVGNDS